MEPDDEPLTLDDELAILTFLEAATKAIAFMQDMNRRLAVVAEQANRLIARKIDRHPDLAYLDAQMDGFYGDGRP